MQNQTKALGRFELEQVQSWHENTENFFKVLYEKDAKISYLEGNLELLAKDLDTKTSELSELKKELKSLKEVFRESHEKPTKLLQRQTSGKPGQQIIYTQGELQEKAQKNELEDRFEQDQKDKLEEEETKLRFLNEQNQELQKRLKDYQNDAEAWRQQEMCLKKSVTELSKEKCQLQNSFQERVDVVRCQASRRSRELQKELDTLKKQLNDQMEVGPLRREVKELKKQLSEHEKMIDEQSDRIRNKDRRLAVMEKVKERIELSLRTTEALLNVKFDVIKDQEEQIETLTDTCKAVRDECRAAEIRGTDMKEQLEDVKSKLKICVRDNKKLAEDNRALTTFQKNVKYDINECINNSTFKQLKAAVLKLYKRYIQESDKLEVDELTARGYEAAKTELDIKLQNIKAAMNCKDRTIRKQELKIKNVVFKCGEEMSQLANNYNDLLMQNRKTQEEIKKLKEALCDDRRRLLLKNKVTGKWEQASVSNQPKQEVADTEPRAPPTNKKNNTFPPAFAHLRKNLLPKRCNRVAPMMVYP